MLTAREREREEGSERERERERERKKEKREEISDSRDTVSTCTFLTALLKLLILQLRQQCGESFTPPTVRSAFHFKSPRQWHSWAALAARHHKHRSQSRMRRSCAKSVEVCIVPFPH